MARSLPTPTRHAEAEDILLSPSEVAEVLSCTERRVIELMRAGELPSVRLGARQLRCSAQSLREFVRLGGTPGYLTAKFAAVDRARGVRPG